MTKVRSADIDSLTMRQRDVLAAIRAYRQRHGRAPLLREIAKTLGLASYRSLTKHLDVLRHRGFLEKTRGWRGLATLEHTLALPFLGTIRAGRPQTEEASPNLSLRLPQATLSGVSHPERCYVLRVSGDSMSPLLEPGDLVLIDPNRAPKDGDVVVALVDEQENTLKTLRRSRTGEWILWAEHKGYPPIVTKDIHDLRVQGVMVKKLVLAG